MPSLIGGYIPEKGRVFRKTRLSRIKKVILPGYEHMPLDYHPDIPYRNNYVKLQQKLTDQKVNKDDWYRALCKEDMFFFTYFHLKIKKANHWFVVDRCKEIEDGPENDILDLWARGHFKSTLLTTVKPIQKILRNPEERICIFSFKQDAALKFFLPIKTLLEKDTILHRLFPNILTPDLREYPLWTRDIGITVKRKGFYREPTLMWSALSEGMPTGMHFTGKIFDDIMTADMVTSPAEMQRVKTMFDMAQNLTDNDTGHDQTEWNVVAGTPYDYNDVFKHIQDKTNLDGSPAYEVRFYPATADGTWNGRPVMLTQEALDRLKRNEKEYASQQLLKPMQEKERKLVWEAIKRVSKDELPKNLYNFLLVDPAGDLENMKTKHKGDHWAIALLGVEPFRDAMGQSNIYLLNLVKKQFGIEEAIETIFEMFVSGAGTNQRVLKVCIEKTGISSYDYHISQRMRKAGRLLTVKNGGIMLLRPGIRNKTERIKTALEWPFKNGKWHYLDTIAPVYLQALKEEIEQFPRGKDDGIDLMSYAYDVIADYKFPERDLIPTRAPKINDMWLDENELSVHSITNRPWMVR